MRQLVHADFDGRFWVGSFEPGGVVVVDTTAASRSIDAGCGRYDGHDAIGSAPVASDRHRSRHDGAPTTAPVCLTYEPNDRYPIRLCDEGTAVAAIQQALVAAGHQLEVDGYFGPLTEPEVRRFQEAHGLEVDGLVGDDTWPALMAFAPPVGTDDDGSGVIDPWELGQPTPADRRPPTMSASSSNRCSPTGYSAASTARSGRSSSTSTRG